MSHIKEIDFVVFDLETSVRFFQEVLEFTEQETREEKGGIFEQLYQESKVHARRTRMRLGKENIYLTEFIHPRGKPFSKDSMSSDLWFQHIAIVVSDMEKAYQKLMDCKAVPISSSPQVIPEWNQAAAGIKAFYFRSPNHHPLEIIFYPPGKGRKEWQQRSSLFLGIDHTAIAVSDTQTSLQFYQDFLELQVMGESLNFGETQEKLTSVPGAKVKITGMRDRKEKGIGLEFLHYLEGTKGRKMKHAPHDITATKIVIETPHINEILERLNRKFIVSEFKMGKRTQAAIIHDPDEHHILLIEENFLE